MKRGLMALATAVMLCVMSLLGACSSREGEPARDVAVGQATAPAPAQVAAPAPVQAPAVVPAPQPSAVQAPAPVPAPPLPLPLPPPAPKKAARPPTAAERSAVDDIVDAAPSSSGRAPASARRPQATTPCPSQGLAPFPWPSPPQPTITAPVPPRRLAGNGSLPKSLADVGVLLDDAINKAGYLQPRYLGAGCGGFAIVLDLEHIEDDGQRKPGTAGFAPPSQDEGFSLAGYIKRLFIAPPGHYRQIVLVVSDARMGQTTAAPTEAEMRAIARDGASSLAAAFASVPYTAQHEVVALIYEFEKGPRDGDARVVPPQGRLGATTHLKQARIY